MKQSLGKSFETETRIKISACFVVGQLHKIEITVEICYVFKSPAILVHMAAKDTVSNRILLCLQYTVHHSIHGWSI